MNIYESLEQLEHPYQLQNGHFSLEGARGRVTGHLEGGLLKTPHGIYGIPDTGYFLAELMALHLPMQPATLFAEMGLPQALEQLGGHLEVGTTDLHEIPYALRVTLPDGRWITGQYIAGTHQRFLTLAGVTVAECDGESKSYPVTAQDILKLFAACEKGEITEMARLLSEDSGQMIQEGAQQWKAAGKGTAGAD